MRALAIAVLFAAAVAAQPKISPQEQEELETALAEAGSSPVDYLRALEKHLAKYPDSPRKAELERAAARAAIEARDDRRVILYGERVLAARPDDVTILEPVARALAAGADEGSAKAGLRYAIRLEELGRQTKNASDRVARALVLESQATARLGRADEALVLAQRAFEIFPMAEAARAIAACYERLAKPWEAARAMADAFTIPDRSVTAADRERDRARMGDLYRRAKGSEAGLGDLVLEAYDRNVALVHTRELRLRSRDPNAQLSDPMQFTLGGVANAPKLNLATVRGKVAVFDFWATWCVPCREQHPLYEQVKQQFRDDARVVFLSVSTDEDRAAVPPFLHEVNWKGPAYFEDGLSRALDIRTIPTTIIMDAHGKVFSRLTGFEPRRFVEMLGGRIREALGE